MLEHAPLACASTCILSCAWHVLGSIDSSAQAFCVDLTHGELDAGEWARERPKAKYIFICQNEEQARGWCAALEACCPPLPQRTNAVPLTTMVGQDSSGHLRSPSGKEFVTSGV
jgi:hypothetical protein